MEATNHPKRGFDSFMRTRKNPIAMKPLTFLLFFLACATVSIASEPFRNPDLPIPQRLDDLLDRLTIEERAGFLSCQTAAVPRLGIPRYWFWNEGLHGIMHGTPSTQFPQSIAVASTWNPDLAKRMARTTALEGRAYDSDPANPKWPWGGMWFFSPNINLVRDPRWGRTQETYGEDPLLAGSMTVGFVKGMQGENPEKELICVATPKHFALNNEEVRVVSLEGATPGSLARHFAVGSEFRVALEKAEAAGEGIPMHVLHQNDKDRQANTIRLFRYEMNAEADKRYLYDYDFVPFRMAVEQAGCASFMASYNAVNGVPASISHWLLTDVLRKEWGFRGAVVSDLGAGRHLDINYEHKPPRGHRMFDGQPRSSAEMVKAGLNMDLGKPGISERKDQTGVVEDLMAALKTGYITEEQITVSSREVLDNMMRLGLFTPPDRQPYANLPKSLIGAPEHVELAREIARSSFVLLKNKETPQGGKPLLPLDRNKLRKVLLAGPYTSGVALGNYSGRTANRLISFAEALRSFGRKAGFEVVVDPWFTPSKFSPIISSSLRTSAGPDAEPGLKGEYFANTELAGTPIGTRIDAALQLLANENIADDMINLDGFSVRWTGFLVAPADGKFRITFTGRGQSRVWLGDNLVFDGWEKDPEKAGTGEWKDVPDFRTGQLIPVRVEYRGTKAARTSLQWLSSAQRNPKDYADADVVLLTAGLTPADENEGGFSERSDLYLSTEHEDFVRMVTGANPKTVLLLQGGSALAVPWAKENIPAIMMTWYPGEQAGNALVDLLFGDVSPAARLPLTFYAGNEQLRPPDEYDLSKGRTYMFLREKPLWAFGHGLSYTTFDYGDLQISKASAGQDETVKITVAITNRGIHDSDEVAQLYVAHPDSAVPQPIRQLRGFQRKQVKAGQTETFEFLLPIRELSSFDLENDRSVVDPGVYRIEVGAASDDIRLTGELKVQEQ
jgi:beta-glucosidase